MSTKNDAFSQAVLRCTREITDALVNIAPRYSDEVMVTSLAEHVAGALRICTRNGRCTPEQARRLVVYMCSMTGIPLESLTRAES